MTEAPYRIADALALRVVARLSGGVFGAHQVKTAGGARAVLKVLPDWPELALDNVRRAAALVSRLRERGYPAPRFLDIGVVDDVVYTVQEYVAGTLPERLTPDLARELVELWRAHGGAAAGCEAGSRWGAATIAKVHAAGELRSATSDPRVLAVVERALAIAAAADPHVFRTDDIVHGDFHLGNVLVRDGRIAAVFDWEQARAGDCRADLLRLYAAAATWERPESPVLVVLREELVETAPPEIRLPIGAEIAVHHLRYGLFARPKELEWVLREAEHLMSRY